MPTRLTDDEVRKVAQLARLRLSDEEIHHFADQLSHVLGYINKLTELDVTNVEPMAHPTDMTNRFRPDTPGEPLLTEKVLQNAPDADDAFFKVPKVLGDGSSA